MRRFFKTCSVSILVLSVPLFITLISYSYFFPDSFILEDNASIYKVGDYPIHVQCNSPVTAEAEKSLAPSSGSSTGSLMMLGSIPVKDVELKVEEEKEVIVSGQPFGIKLFTEGVLVVGTGEVETGSASVNPGEDAGLMVGDIVMSIDGQPVNSNEETAKIIENCDGGAVNVHCIRNGVDMDFVLRPAQSALDGRYKAGLWVRDSTAGIGTMTFVDPQTGVYGGLGHGVCDVDTGKLMPMSDGEIVPVKICGITKGLPGEAGELLGFFTDAQCMGTLNRNTAAGVYGRLSQTLSTGKRMSVAYKQNIIKGKAQILSTISGNEARLYDITIEKVNYDKDNPTKNMVIRITDPELLKLTGGIVQGMSGSPIIQNGKLVGAVTHVFVNDPTSGYGIFAENMINQSKKIEKNVSKQAA